MKSHRPPVLKPLAAALLALATGCSAAAGSASNTGRLETTNVSVDAFEAIDTVGLWIAQDEGLFRANGLNVTIKPVQLVNPEIDDMVNGKVDIGSGDYVTFIKENLLGDPDPGMHNVNPELRIIGESSFLQPNVLDLLVPRSAKVKSIAQLAHARIAVLVPQNISDVLVFSLLQDHGLSLKPLNTQHFPDVQFGDIPKAFATNQADAAFAPEPFPTLFEEGVGIQELADLDQGSTTNFPIQGYITTKAWAQQHPNTLRAFDRALNEGQRIADTNRAEVEKVLEKFLGLKPIVADLVALPTFPIGVDAIRIQRTVTALIRFHFIPQKFANFQVSSMIAAP